jgi:hypothetical protein
VARRRREPAEPADPFAQPDPYEQAVQRHAAADPLSAVGEEPPAYPRRISTRTLLLVFGGLFAVLLLLKVGSDQHFPAVQGSCTSPAYALDRTKVKQYGVVSWAARGDAADSFVLGIDTTAVPADRAHGRLFPQVRLTGCAAHGRFGVLVPPGKHVVTAFVVGPDGTGTAVGTTKLTVEPR